MHKLVHHDGDLRVLDVEIPPGETTLYHTHDAAIAYAAIDTSPTDSQPLGGTWEGARSTDPPRFTAGTVTWNLDYAVKPFTHRVRNVGDGHFRLIAVVNQGKGAAMYVARPLLDGAPDDQCRWFSCRRLALDPGARIHGTNGDTRVVVVQATAGAVGVRGGSREELAGPGSFVVIPAHAGYALDNRSQAPALLLAVEVR